MSMPISAMGTMVSPAPQPTMAQRHAAEVKIAAFERFESSLPGNNDSSEKIPLDLNAAAADLERVSYAFNKKLQFVVDQQSHEVIVKVIDGETDKVIKILPPEELQRLHDKIRETIGFLFDERV
jgi:flagellar protein FlaG